jgi:hypothetical protein
MDFFRNLGLAVRDEWAKTDFDELAFPEIASAALLDRPPSEHVGFDDVIHWLRTTPELVVQRSLEQRSLDRVFGQPPVTVFSDPRFYIDVLFWVDGTTTIHQHGFSGSFHVMSGCSIEARYAFELEQRFNSHLVAGKLTLTETELLRTGDTRPILSKDATIHSLFHLTRPSISVVVRTVTDPDSGPQFNYRRSGIGWDPFYKPQPMVLQLKTLDLLHTIEHPEFERIASEMVQRADAFSAYNFLEHLALKMTPYDRFAAFLETVASHHPRIVERMASAGEEIVRDSNIVRRRAGIRDADHRLFMALLLNLPNRESILDMMGKIYPDRRATDAIVSWVGDLSRLPSFDPREPNVLGIELDELSLFVFEQLLEGAGNQQVLGRLCERYSREEVDDQAQDILALCHAFRDSLLFKPLFAD